MYVISYGIILCDFIVYDHVHALSATSTHFKWELMYCLHCPTLNKVFLLLLLLLRYAWAVMHVGITNPRWRGNVPGIPGKCTTP